MAIAYNANLFTGQRRQQFHDSISKHDFLTPLKQSRRKRYPGTAEWLFNTDQFKRWFIEGESQVLWSSGKSASLPPKPLSRNYVLTGRSWIWENYS